MGDYDPSARIEISSLVKRDLGKPDVYVADNAGRS